MVCNIDVQYFTSYVTLASKIVCKEWIAAWSFGIQDAQLVITDGFRAYNVATQITPPHDHHLKSECISRDMFEWRDERLDTTIFRL